MHIKSRLSILDESETNVVYSRNSPVICIKIPLTNEIHSHLWFHPAQVLAFTVHSKLDHTSFWNTTRGSFYAGMA